MAAPQTLTIALAGNPNCGKTTLFNQLTGSRQRVGNFPGVTVESKQGEFVWQNQTIVCHDLPGLYSLDLSSQSLDIVAARSYLLTERPDVIINIVDASNLERHLYLSSQLMELGIPMILAVNMMDIADSREIEIHFDRLEDALHCKAFPITAKTGEGLERLKDELISLAQNRLFIPQTIRYQEEIEQAIAQIVPVLKEKPTSCQAPERWQALSLLANEQDQAVDYPQEAIQLANTLREKIEKQSDENIGLHIANGRYQFANRVTQKAVEQHLNTKPEITDKIDRFVLHKYFGLPFFIFVMYLMFTVTINIGGAFVDFFDQLSGLIFIDSVHHFGSMLHLPEWLLAIIADGIGGGIQVVSTFIPIIGSLYLFLSFLEDTGYMARVAFILDRMMRSLGLPGNAFVPLIVGFGCNVPAVMASRTLDKPRERILTIMMTPFMSCGARLSVYAVFVAAFFASGGQLIVLALYLTGILMAVLTAILLKHTLLPGKPEPFLLELPNYHMPSFSSVLIHSWQRLKGFLLEAGQIIIIMVMIINFLGSLGTDGSFGNNNNEKSILSQISKSLTPLLSPFGVQEDNWPATVGIFTGVLAKEVVVGALDAVYSSLDEGQSPNQQQGYDFSRDFKASFQTIADNFSDLESMLTDPLGLSIVKSDQQAAADEQSVSIGTFGQMAKRFDGNIGAFAYLLFILLYFPCVATVAAIYREAGSFWAISSGVWNTWIAFSVATLFYQIARFNQHPQSSLGWIIALLTIMAAFVIWLKHYSGKPVMQNRLQQYQPIQIKPSASCGSCKKCQ